MLFSRTLFYVACLLFWLPLGPCATPIARADAPVATVTSRSATSADGVRIVYDVRGHSDSDTTLFFVHCWACNRSFWRDQVDVFASRFRVVTIDLPGHGDSGHERAHWSAVGLAQDVITVADELRLKRIILIGHSMGGPVSLEAAHRMPGRVIGVVLVDTLHDVDDRRSPAAAEADAERLRRDFKGYFSDLSPIFWKDSDPSIRHWVEQQAMATDPGAAIGLKLDTPNIDPKALFRNAGVPIRAINALPPLTDRTNVEENRRFGDYAALFVRDAGHFVQLERPGEFNRDLGKWVESFRKPARAAPGLAAVEVDAVGERTANPAVND
jgi:pimeloyl-ACP methyl ester carboxylesterase